MNTLQHLAYHVAARQDFLWFLVMLSGVLFVAIGWRRGTRRENAAVAAGVAGVVALAGIAWGAFLWPSRPQSEFDVPHRWADLAAGFALAGTITAWAGLGLRSSWPRAEVVAGVFAAAVAAGRMVFPEAGMVMLAVAVLGAAIVAVRGGSGLPAVEAGVMVAAFWLSPPGVVAWWLDTPLRAVDLAALTPVGALIMLAAILLPTARLVRADWVRQPAGQRVRVARRLRVFAAAMLSWLLLGVLLATVAGRSARRLFEKAATDRLRAYADTFPTEELAAALAADWVPNGLRAYRQQSGQLTPYGIAEPFKSLDATMKHLLELWNRNRDFSMIEISVLRDGREWIVVLPGVHEDYRGVVTVARDETVAARAHWEAGGAWVEGPVRLSVGEAVLVRAPLRDGAGDTLAWLQASYLVGDWARVQAQARLQAFGLLTAGALVGLLLLVRRLREEEREDALREAERERAANRLKSAFLANVSHELRTPVQSLTGYTELLLRDELSETARARVEALQRNGELMARLINDLIDIGALDSGAFRFIEKPAQPAVLVIHAVESLRPRAEAKGLELTCSVEKGVPGWVRMDPERCRQVVINLVGNAVKYTERGRVEVRVAARPAEGEGRTIIAITVCDTGPGIPLEQQAGIFDPFSRLDRTATVEGVGLGLALSRRLARHMGGDITVESEPGAGSAFTAELAVEPGEAPAVATAAASGLRGKRILVVDDNPLVRDLFVQGLRLQGADCAEASDGEEALRRLGEASFDGMVLDLAMPGLEGWDVARRVREQGQALRIVGVSAHAGGAERERALRVGMDEFLTKPVDLARLARAFAEDGVSVSADAVWRQRMTEWEAYYRAELPERLAELEAAVERERWEDLFKVAHRLRNSAMVVRDEAVFNACGELQASAGAGDAPVARRALEHCRAAITPWLAGCEPAPPPQDSRRTSGNNPEQIENPTST